MRRRPPMRVAVIAVIAVISTLGVIASWSGAGVAVAQPGNALAGATERAVAVVEPPAATTSLAGASSPAAFALAGDRDPVAVLEAANAAYLAGDFDSASAGYRSLVAAGHRHPLLYYNLGNAYLRQGELGRAIASYRWAAAGAPRDQEVRANLAYARKTARDAVAPPEPSMVWRTVFAWHYVLAPSELWLAAAALNLALWSLLAVRLWRRHEALTWAAAAIGLLLVVCLTSLAYHRVAPSRVAVVVPREVDVRSGLRDDTVVRFKLHAGSEVAVREQRDGWLRIALPSGEQGWIEAAAAEVVEL